MAPMHAATVARHAHSVVAHRALAITASPVQIVAAAASSACVLAHSLQILHRRRSLGFSRAVLALALHRLLYG